MKLYALSEEVINNTLTYLSSKPYAEVTSLIAELKSGRLLVNADGTPLEESKVEELPPLPPELPKSETLTPEVLPPENATASV